MPTQSFIHAFSTATYFVTEERKRTREKVIRDILARPIVQACLPSTKENGTKKHKHKHYREYQALCQYDPTPLGQKLLAKLLKF